MRLTPPAMRREVINFRELEVSPIETVAIKMRSKNK